VLDAAEEQVQARGSFGKKRSQRQKSFNDVDNAANPADALVDQNDR